MESFLFIIQPPVSLPLLIGGPRPALFRFITITVGKGLEASRISKLIIIPIVPVYAGGCSYSRTAISALNTCIENKASYFPPPHTGPIHQCCLRHYCRELLWQHYLTARLCYHDKGRGSGGILSKLKDQVDCFNPSAGFFSQPPGLNAT